MKKKFLNSSMNAIKKYYPEYDEEKLEIIEYGLESLYIKKSITTINISTGSQTFRQYGYTTATVPTTYYLKKVYFSNPIGYYGADYIEDFGFENLLEWDDPLTE